AIVCLGVVVRWCGDYVIVWSVEYNHSFITIDESINYDIHELYATHWLSFEVDSEVVQSAEGLCTRAYNPRAVEFQYSLNPETTEYDYNDFNSFVYQFTQHRNTIRFKTRLRRLEGCEKPSLFDEYVGEVAIDTSDLDQLVKYNIFNVDLCQLGKILHGPGGRAMDRHKVVIPPDTLRPKVDTANGAAPSMFTTKLTREERLRRNQSYHPMKTNEERHQSNTGSNPTKTNEQKHQSYEHANTKPWGLLNSTSVQSAIEQTVNMDCITVFRQMSGASVEFYVIFSKTHRLQYIGGDFRPGHFLSSRSLRLINYIAPPRFVDAKKFKMREMPDDIAEYIVILTLRARVWNYGNGDLVIESDDVGPIKVDADWVPSARIPSDFPKGAVVEIEFVRDSWCLRKLHGHWHDGLDLRRLDSPYIWPGYTVQDAEYRGRKYAHGVEECVERAVLRQNFNDEQSHDQRRNQARLDVILCSNYEKFFICGLCPKLCVRFTARSSV
ncbi:hypothetical protein ANCCAN_21547, partial [Ancylostoma caninum]